MVSEATLAALPSLACEGQLEEHLLVSHTNLILMHLQLELLLQPNLKKCKPLCFSLGLPVPAMMIFLEVSWGYRDLV